MGYEFEVVQWTDAGSSGKTIGDDKEGHCLPYE